MGFFTDVRCNVTCPSCRTKFKIVRKFETHLPNCLKDPESDAQRGAVKALGRRLRRLAAIELERITSIKAGQYDGVVLAENAGDSGRPTDLPGDLVDDSKAVTNLPNLNSQQLQPPPLESLDGNDSNFEFPAAYPTNNSPLLHRYARGPVLSSNPMEWSQALAVPSHYMAVHDISTPAQYANPGPSQNMSQVGGGGMETFYVMGGVT